MERRVPEQVSTAEDLSPKIGVKFGSLELFS